MFKKIPFRHLTLPSILGSILLCQGHVHAQQTAPVRVGPNEQVLQSWQHNNQGGAVPQLLQDEDGTTRLDWRAGITLDVYSNDIQSANGSSNTPLRSGNFYKTQVNSDLRAIYADSTVDHFQLGVTQSDDRAVLSQNQYQINNLQVGRTAENYRLALGDIAPNFSSLGSALGARGVYGQRQFGEFTVHGFSGQVAENWEVLSSTVPSNQYLKDVHGLKLEKAFGSALRTYVTAQTFSEREAPLMAQPGFAALGTSHSMSVGMQYQMGQFNLAAETARSSFESDSAGARQGQAFIVDATWHGGNVGVRAGHHHLDSEFTSLSMAAQPGVHETYIGMDWTAAQWVTLATDLRKSKNSTLATVYSDATFVDTDAFTVRANINFGPEHPGWGISLQNVEAKSVDSADQVSRRSDFSAMLNYAAPGLNASVGAGRGNIRSEAYPSSDSATESWSVNIGRTFSDASPDRAPNWSAGINFFATSQSQRLLVDGGTSNNTNLTLALSAQRVGWGSVNLLLMGGETTQPYGGPGLRMRAVQLEALLPMRASNTFKVFLRNTQRNLDDVLLFGQENVAGFQLVYNF